MEVRSSKPNLGISEQEALDFIIGFCKAEVLSRGGELNETDQFRSRVRSVAKWLTESKRPSILLVGSCGNGKTTIARALCQLINNANRLRGASNDRVWVYSAEDIVKAANGKLEGKEGVFPKMKKCPMLLIDDLATETLEVKEYGNSSFPIVELLSTRYEYQLCTIATTNESVDVLGDRYGSRIADRINEAFAIIPFEAESFRK